MPPFSNYMIEKNVRYDRQSGKELKKLEDLAKFEGYTTRVVRPLRR